jgi:hypothetical protein
MATVWALRHPKTNLYWNGRVFAQSVRTYATKQRALTAYDKHAVAARRWDTPVETVILEEIEVIHMVKGSTTLSPDKRVLSLAAFEKAHTHDDGPVMMYRRLLRLKSWDDYVVMVNFKTMTPYDTLYNYRTMLKNMRIEHQIGFYYYTRPTTLQICFKSEANLTAFTMIAGAPSSKIDLKDLL